MTDKHDHGVRSNSDESMTTFIGCQVFGFVKAHRTHEFKILVFDCGWGLAIHNAGAHWTVSPEEVRRHVNCVKEELQKLNKELRNVIRLADGAEIA